MDDDEKTVSSNVDEDMASMMLAAGIWHIEHAHLVSNTFVKTCWGDWNLVFN